MNHLISKVKELHRDYFSLIFVPEGGRPFFELKLRRLYIWIFAIMIALGSIYSLIMTNATSTVRSSLNTNISLNNDLKSSTSEQEAHIKELETDLISIKEKIADLTELEYNVRAMVGLSPLSPSLTLEKVNRSADRTSNITNNTDITTESSGSEYESTDVSTIETNPTDLNSELTLKLENMNTLVKEVENRLKYIASYPDRWPTTGKISSYFGSRTHPIYGSYDFHTGLDISNSYRTPIVASGSGKVTYSAYKSGYGYTIIINHGYGYQTLYGHNSSLLVSVGDYVDKGDVIAKMGSTGTSTGNHCHFEIIKNGVQINPLETLK